MARQAELRVIDNVPKALLVGGHWQEAGGGATFPVHDPSTGETLCEVADASPDDGMDALAAAVDAQAGWAARPPRERAEILRRAFEALKTRQDELALLMTLEMGKPVPDSRTEIAYAADFLRWFSEEASRIEGSYKVAPAGGSRLLTMLVAAAAPVATG